MILYFTKTIRLTVRRICHSQKADFSLNKPLNKTLCPSRQIPVSGSIPATAAATIRFYLGPSFNSKQSKARQQKAENFN
jgi:hypothetical protein